ncbi:hypothetical protein BGZ68_003985 [Mortierella alpina]|nr:hypothetical protein BGZ68_003985 [Mortierella alpina]
MMPTAFVRLDALPLTANGKLDRRALPKPQDDAYARKEYAAPKDGMESVVASIWAELLGVHHISRYDSFFALGGHSLLVVRMLERLHRIGLTVPVRTLFESPTLQILAQSLIKHESKVVPTNLITPDTQALTPELLPLTDLTQDDLSRIVKEVAGGASNIQDIYSLSPLQDGIMFHHLLATEGDPYLLVSHMAFESRNLLDRYLKAFQKVVNRHDILRTAFFWEGTSTPAQVVFRHALCPLDAAQGSIIKQLSQRFNGHSYRLDLTQAPLLRFATARDTDGRWVLVQMVHHLIADHAALEAMNGEVEKFLEGKEATLSPPRPFRNLISQVRSESSEKEQELFFKEMLHDVDEPALPFQMTEVHSNGDMVQEAHMIMPSDLNARLRVQAKRFGVSLAALCHAAWAQVLAQSSGQEQIVFGTVLVGGMKGEQGEDHAMGLSINTLPFCCDMDNRSAKDCRYRYKLQNEFISKEERVNYPGIEFLGGQERTNYPCVLSVEDFNDALGLTAQILRPVAPVRVCGYMEQALGSLVWALETDSHTAVSQLEVVPIEERTLLLQTWNATEAPYPDQVCVHILFEEQAKKTPKTIALANDDGTLSYSHLNAHANRLTRRLGRLGVQSGDFVVILLDCSFELVVAQLAILKAGAAYVPIDPKAPVD